MIQENTIKTILRLVGPLVDCGVISQEEIDEVKDLLKNPPVTTKEEPVQTLITQQEAAKILHVTVKTIGDYIREGRLVRKKLGRRSVRITVQSLNQLIKSAQ